MIMLNMDVYKTQASVTGGKDLSDGITITEGENDTLRLKINDETELRTIELLGEDETKKHYTLYQLLEKINAEIEKKDLNITAKESGNRLELISNYYGSNSRVQLDPTSNAYEDLFVGEEEIILEPMVIEGAETSATITGRYVLGEV